MTRLGIHINDATEARLRSIAVEFGCPVERLAEISVEEMARDYFRDKSADPGSGQGRGSLAG